MDRTAEVSELLGFDFLLRVFSQEVLFFLLEVKPNDDSSRLIIGKRRL